MFKKSPRLIIQGRSGARSVLNCEWLHFDFLASSVEIDEAILNVWTDANENIRQLTLGMTSTRNAKNRLAGLDNVGVGVRGILQAKCQWAFGHPVFEIVTDIGGREVQRFATRVLAVGKVLKIKQPRMHTILPSYNILDPKPQIMFNGKVMNGDEMVKLMAPFLNKQQKVEEPKPEKPGEA